MCACVSARLCVCVCARAHMCGRWCARVCEGVWSLARAHTHVCARAHVRATMCGSVATHGCALDFNPLAFALHPLTLDETHNNNNNAGNNAAALLAHESVVHMQGHNGKLSIVEHPGQTGHKSGKA